MLKFKIAKLEDVEEKYRGLYEPGADGAYYLTVEGAVSKEKLDEFRNTNIDLMKKLEPFKNIDPAKLQEMIDNERKIAEKKLIDAGDIDGLVAQRVATMKQEYESKIKDLETNYAQANRQLEVLVIDNAVREQAIKLGVVPTAVDDVLLRAKTVFSVEGGKPVAKDRDGNMIYGKDGQSSLSIGDWISGLKNNAPHLFGPSQGSGADNRRGPSQDNAPLSPAAKISAGLRAGNSAAIQ